MRNFCLAVIVLAACIESQDVFSKSIKVGVAQTVIENSLGKNCTKLLSFIDQAKAKECRIVIFPKEVFYWPEIAKDSPTRADFDRALAQISESRTGLFRAGSSTKSIWFELKGVRSIVTIGEDVNMIEIGDLAANRGMSLHFHITYETCSSPEEITLFKQKNLLMLMYAEYGAVVNAADTSGLSNPSAPAGGLSMIVSREGGHNKPAPHGLEYYLPYQTSIVKSAGSGEAMILATRKTSVRNDMDLTAYWRNRNRKNRVQSGWYDWIKKGTLLIESTERSEPKATQRSRIE
jgi:predicted amidohydrolase